MTPEIEIYILSLERAQKFVLEIRIKKLIIGSIEKDKIT